MRQHHVEVTLVHRNVDGLADGAAGVVDGRRHVGEFHEVLEVLQRAVAPALVEIHHEGRAVGGREHDAVATDLHRAGGVARVLDELAWRALQDLAQHSRFEGGAHAVEPGAGGAEQAHRLLVAAELDADLGEDAVGRPFDALQAFLAEQVEGRYLPRDVGGSGARIGAGAAPVTRLAPGALRPDRLEGVVRGYRRNFAHRRSPACCIQLAVIQLAVAVSRASSARSPSMIVNQAGRFVMLEKASWSDKLHLCKTCAASFPRSVASSCSRRLAGWAASPGPGASSACRRLLCPMRFASLRRHWACPCSRASTGAWN